MAGYAIRASHGRTEFGGPDFHEQLYDTLRGAPWWLASAAGHGVVVLLLSALAGDGSAARAEAGPLAIGLQDVPVDLEPPVDPVVEPLKPIEEPEEVQPTEPTLVETDVEQDPNPQDEDEIGRAHD